MNPLAQTTCSAMGLDALGLASWVRGTAAKKASPSEVLAMAESYGLHPLSLAVAPRARSGWDREFREENRNFWQWLGGDPTWLEMIQGAGLRLRDGWMGTLPEGLVVPSLDLCRLHHPLRLPADLWASTLRIYRCPWMEQMPLLSWVNDLELIDLANLREVDMGYDLGYLAIGSCPMLRTLGGKLRVDYLDLASCKAFEALPKDLICKAWDLHALPALQTFPDVMPTEETTMRWEDGSGWTSRRSFIVTDAAQ